MCKASVVLLALVATLAAETTLPPVRRVADKDFLIRQKNIIQLLIRPHQLNVFKEQAEIGNSYDIEANLNNYKDPQEMKHFLSLYKHGNLLPRDKVFSVLYKEHVYQLERLFDLFYQAKDYDTFYKTACWARDRVHHRSFVYALSVAVLHREDTKDIILPPPYEIYPEFFVDNTVIQQAYEAKMRNQLGPVVIPYNYSSHIHNYRDLVSYFTEDVGLGTYNTYLNYEFPIWLNFQKYGVKTQRHGEIFYYSHQQLLARYELERLSRGLLRVKSINIGNPVETGFNPHIRYRNGQEMPARPEGIYVRSNDLVDVDDVQILERRLKDVIDSGTLIQETPEGPSRVLLKDVDVMDVLGNLIQGNNFSLNRRYFKSLFTSLLSLYGHSVDPEHSYGVAPGALEHFETAVRDPAYFSITKRIVELFDRYKSDLKSYSHSDLYVPGVKIISVETGELFTYFDDFEFNLNNAIDVNSQAEAEKLDIRVLQRRLNFKPFVGRLTVTSDKNLRVLIRIFVGPKYDHLGRELTLEQKRYFMVECERLPFNLVPGVNEIAKSASESTVLVQDQMTTSDLLNKVNAALEGKEPFYLNSTHQHCGFPKGLLLPRGRKDGFPLTLIVIATPFESQDVDFQPSVTTCGAGINYQDVDNRALGYPFDRVIYNPDNFAVPNLFQRDLIMYHKSKDEFNKL